MNLRAARHSARASSGRLVRVLLPRFSAWSALSTSRQPLLRDPGPLLRVGGWPAAGVVMVACDVVVALVVVQCRWKAYFFGLPPSLLRLAQSRVRLCGRLIVQGDCAVVLREDEITFGNCIICRTAGVMVLSVVGVMSVCVLALALLLGGRRGLRLLCSNYSPLVANW